MKTFKIQFGILATQFCRMTAEYDHIMFSKEGFGILDDTYTHKAWATAKYLYLKLITRNYKIAEV